MGNLVPIQVETQQGEILLTLNLNLNIKLDPEGNLSIKAQPESVSQHGSDLKVRLEKPDIEDNSEIITFGKQVN